MDCRWQFLDMSSITLFEVVLAKVCVGGFKDDWSVEANWSQEKALFVKAGTGWTLRPHEVFKANGGIENKQVEIE
eukprot:11210226-Lingulodinium_polyedra.AAC.1